MEEHEHRRCIRRAKASSQLREDARDGVTSGTSTPRYEPECRCLPILEREVGPFGSTSTGSGVDISATSSTSENIPTVVLSATGDDSKVDNKEEGVVQKPVHVGETPRPTEIETSSEDTFEDREEWEFWKVGNKRGVFSENYDFNLDPKAMNRNSGCPSPKTTPAEPVQAPTSTVPGIFVINNDLISPNTSPKLTAEGKGKQREHQQQPTSNNNNPDIISYTPVSTPASKSLIQLFHPLYEKRSKIVTYNETEHVIRMLQDTPTPGSLSKVNTFQAKFQISHSPSRKSLQGLLNTAIAKVNEASEAAQNANDKGEGSSGMGSTVPYVRKTSLSVPPVPPAPHSSFATHTERKPSEADLATELSNLQIRNASLYEELLLPIFLPESTFSQEHALLISRWTENSRMTPKQAKKEWENHVKDMLDDAIEALKNQQDNRMFKVRKNGVTTDKQDKVLLQLARDEVACSKGREKWYREYKKNVRREKWVRRREKVSDVLLCRGIERDKEGALGEVLRKMSDEGQIPGVSVPSAARVSR